MLARGIDPAAVRATCHGNALAAYEASGRFGEEDWLAPLPIDQRQLFDGNSVLRSRGCVSRSALLLATQAFSLFGPSRPG